MDSEIDGLFDLPLAEFTARRNALAARFKSEGRAEEAATVKAMPKPSLAAWALNQVARRDPNALGALLDVSEGLRKAQEVVMGGGDPAELRAATRKRLSAVATVTERSGAVLREAGSSASSSQIDKMRSFLMTAPMDDEARALLEAGRLTSDLATPPEAAWGPVGVAEDGPAPVRAADRKKARHEVARLARVAEQAEDLASDLALEARDAEAAATGARMAASEARRVALEARRVADEAARRI